MATHATDTSKYKFNHTMLRIKDPVRTIKFYEQFGMKQIYRMNQPDAQFDLYFLAFDGDKAESSGNHHWDREGVLELTHNYGTENDDSYKVASGNEEESKGFGHICVSVDNIEPACKRLEDLGVKFKKRLTDGRMRNIAFALDPDGYWVEIVAHEKGSDTKSDSTDLSTYRFNHSMIRVKDPKVSLDFYQNVMGMTLLRTSEQSEAKFNLYFLGYKRSDEKEGDNKTAFREGLLELTWNYGTEKDENFKGYHNGNTDPKGFGHIAVSVDNIEAACQRWEEMGVTWKKRLTDGRMKWVAFILDPDGYWIEVVENTTKNDA